MILENKVTIESYADCSPVPYLEARRIAHGQAAADFRPFPFPKAQGRNTSDETRRPASGAFHSQRHRTRSWYVYIPYMYVGRAVCFSPAGLLHSRKKTAGTNHTTCCCIVVNVCGSNRAIGANPRENPMHRGHRSGPQRPASRNSLNSLNSLNSFIINCQAGVD